MAARRKAIGSLSRCDERNAGKEKVPGREPILWWHPSGGLRAQEDQGKSKDMAKSEIHESP
jgi:hypothetical protein